MPVADKSAKVIAFSNHKGGVGKTCSAGNIGAGLARRGKKVLLVDVDPQANLTTSFGLNVENGNVYQLLHKNCSAENAIYNALENLDIIPGTLDLAGAEVELSNELGREHLLRKSLASVINKYDYILIDCPPSLGVLTTNALAFADEVIIPLSAEPLSMSGVEKLVDIIGRVQDSVNTKLKLGGVLITKFDGRKVLNKDLAGVIEDYFKDVVFKTKVRDNVSLAEAPHSKVDIFRYNPKCHGAKDYENVCEELLMRN